MKKIFLILLSLFLILVLGNSYAEAKSISLYEQPMSNSKVVATVAAGQAIIPIFTQADWVKVADPSNGNVGWVEKKTLSDRSYPTLMIKTYGEQGKDKNSSGYQVIEINLPNKEQMQNLMQNFQSQQKQFQQLFNQMMQKNMTDFNRMFQIQPSVVPVLQPVILVPGKSEENPAQDKKKE